MTQQPPAVSSATTHTSLGPAGMSKDLVAKYNAAFTSALQAADVKAKFANLMAEPVATSSDEFARFMRSELAKYEKVVKLSGAKVD